MVAEIHALAFVHPKARVADGVRVGPFAYVGEEVEIGEGTVLHDHASVTGRATIGKRNTIFPGVVIGAPPQDLSYRGEPTRCAVGDENVIRESVTINCGTKKGGGITRVGNRNFIMACAHVGHDVEVGDDNIIANAVLLGGHAKVASRVVFGGGAALHHFATVGRCAFVGGMSRIVLDVPPFTIAEGNPSRLVAINVVGCRRGGFAPNVVEALRRAFKSVIRDASDRSAAIEEWEHGEVIPEVAEFFAAIRASEKGRHGRALEGLRTW